MNALLIFYCLVIFVAALLSAIAIWSPRRTFIRTLSVILVALLVPLGYLGVTELLSRPKPMEHEWFKRHVDEATILGVSVNEGQAIYLWLRIEDSFEPRYYVLPWRRQLAEKLQNLIDEAMQEQAVVKLKNPFSRKSFDNLGSMSINIIRPPSPPMKPPPPPAQFFNPREHDA